MIVLKKDDTVYIATSSWNFRDVTSRRGGPVIADNLCIWHPQGRKNRLIATTFSSRYADSIRYEKIFPDHPDVKTLVTKTYPHLMDICDTYGLCGDGETPMYTVFAEGGKAFAVYPNGFVYEIEDMFSKCFGEDSAVYAAYEMLGGDDPKAFFRAAYKAVSEIAGMRLFPLAMLNTKNNKIEIIKE